MKLNQGLIGAVGIVCAAFSSTAQQPGTSIIVTGKVSRVQNSPNQIQPADVAFVDGDEMQVRKEMSLVINELIAKKDYASLDKMADDLRKSKTQIASGLWRLLM